MQQLILLGAEYLSGRQQRYRPINIMVRLQGHPKLGLPVSEAVYHDLGC